MLIECKHGNRMVMMDQGIVQVNFVTNPVSQKIAMCRCAININELVKQTKAGDE